MKSKIGILLGLVLVMICAFALADVAINETNFPDENFRNVVTAFDQNGNAVLSDDEIAAVHEIDCAGQSVSDLKGIEFFPAVETLYCHENKISALDVSKNTALKVLHCDNNELTSLDVSGNTALQRLDCAFNDISSIDVSKNTALETLDCTANQIYALDVGANTALKSLTCQSCRLSALDLSANPKLAELDCTNNQLTALDISRNSALRYLVCMQNSLEQLDISSIPKLNNLVNETEPTDRGDSLLWAKEKAAGGFSLYLEVDKDLHIITVETIVLPEVEINETNFPDVSFREVVKQFDTDEDDALSEGELASVVEINCSNWNIYDLKGIEYFTALQKLECSSNQLTSLDVSRNTALQELYCAVNRLTSLDVSANSALWMLSCHRNELTALDLSGCTALEELICDYNRLAALNMSANAALTHLSCTSNQLKSLDVGNNTALKKLHCYANELVQLDVSKNPVLNDLVKKNEPAEENGHLVWRIGEDENILTVDMDVKVVTDEPEQIDISKAKITAIKAQVYTGKAIKPTVTVKYGGKKLIKDTDYSVSYKNNKKIGSATVTITGKGDYTGKKTVKFDIIPKGVKISSLTAGKKQLTVKWAKGSSITGYEIEYSLKKNFKDSKFVTIKKAATTKTVLKKLQAKKTYYIRIRAYKTVNGKKYYSAWSAIKNKKTK